MFGKFGKKKPEDPVKSENKSKQKNDLFTLLEESPTKNEKTLNSTQKNKPAEQDENNATSKDVMTKSMQTESKNNQIKEKKSREGLNPVPDKEPKKASISSKQEFYPQSSIKGDKFQHLLLEIEKLPDKTIKPVVDFNESSLFYPILAKVGEDPDNIGFLDELVETGDLTKHVFEKLIICPLHPNAYSSSVRLYCPKCNSLNVDKLNLYEHKRCGYITESSEYDFARIKNPVCPSCNRKIEDFKKEIRMPAMWHQCLDCNDKFDNAIIKLYCRQHEHDFETGSGQFITTHSYRLKDYDAPITSDDEKMHDDLAQILGEFNFSVDFKPSVKGKSGNLHKIPIYASNNSLGESIAIFVNRSTDNVSQGDINAILIPILDVGPKHTLLLATSGVGDDVRPLAKQYGIDIISDPDLSRIIHHVDEFVSERYSRNGDK